MPRPPAFFTHLAFVTDRRVLFEAPGPVRRCVACHQEDDVDMSCERCGAPLHGTCHFERIASAGEQAIVEAALAEMNARRPLEINGREALLWAPPAPAEQAVDRLILLCPGCLS